MDMDVSIAPKASNITALMDYDLVYTGSYSFMFTYSSPTPVMIQMWKNVLNEVRSVDIDALPVHFMRASCVVPTLLHFFRIPTYLCR